MLEVPNVPLATLKIKPRVNQKSSVPRSVFGFIISDAPQFRNPYLTKVTNQLGSKLLVTYADRDTFSICLELLK
jgi:capsid portal protein